MTRDGQNSQYKQAVFSRFTGVESELDCLLLAVKNLLSDYREYHPDFPIHPGADAEEEEDQEEVARRELKNLCGHRSRFGGNFSQLEARLNGRLEETSFEATAKTQMDLDDLDNILSTQTASLPLVEVHPEYFTQVDAYDVQAGQFGANETPILLPIQVEEDFIIYWDPIADYYEKDKNCPVEMALSETTFLRLWSRAERARWTLWIDGQEQKTLAGFTDKDQ